MFHISRISPCGVDHKQEDTYSTCLILCTNYLLCLGPNRNTIKGSFSVRVLTGVRPASLLTH